MESIGSTPDQGDDTDEEPPMVVRPGRSPTTPEREARIRKWQAENAEALHDYNRFVEENGILLAEYRTF